MAAYAPGAVSFPWGATACRLAHCVRISRLRCCLVPVFGLWEQTSFFVWITITVLGAWSDPHFGGRGDVCLGGQRHSGIILIYVAMNLPFVIWILPELQSCRCHPRWKKPRRVDGAGPFQTFFPCGAAA